MSAALNVRCCCRAASHSLLALSSKSVQRMIDGPGGLRDAFECRSLVSRLTARRLAGGFAQRARLLGKTIGRRRLAGITAVLAHLCLQRLDTRQQSVDLFKQRDDPPVLVGFGQLRKVGTGQFLYHPAMMNEAWRVYNLFVSQSLRLNSHFRISIYATTLIDSR